LSSAPLAVCLVVVTTACGLVNALLESVNVALEFLPGQRLPIFSMSSDICHKTQTPPVPLPSPVPGSRQRIPGITQGLCFLSHPSRLRFTVGCLLKIPLTELSPSS
jgi:hypothetical protein